mgnify:CR=1 FL=1
MEITNLSREEKTDFNESEQIWEKTLVLIKENVHEQSYITWFKPIVPLHVDEQRIVLQVPSQFFYDWLEGHYSEMIRSKLYEATNKQLSVEYHVRQSVPSEETFEEAQRAIPKPSQPNSQYNQRTPDFESKLNPRYNFSTFIEGDGNKFAKAASLAVAEAPGKTAFNPLVIFGDTGLGKTHVMQAIGNFAKSEGRVRKVYYATSEQFTSDFIKSISENNTSEFSSFYRDIDLLLVDDIQFFAGKGKTQEEFFHTFNALHNAGKQIVLTCDRPMSELRDLEERLVSRFQWGLVVDIQPPDFETRVAILQKRAEESGVRLHRDVIEYLGANVTSSIRELEGTLIRITAQASITGQEITLELAKSIVNKIGKNVQQAITIEDIMKTVADYFGIQENLLLEKTRKKEIVIARQIAMYLAKQLTTHTVKSIGLHFGGRDHTTVLYSCKTVEEQLECDQMTAQHVDNIQRKLDQIF